MRSKVVSAGRNIGGKCRDIEMRVLACSATMRMAWLLVVRWTAAGVSSECRSSMME